MEASKTTDDFAEWTKKRDEERAFAARLKRGVRFLHLREFRDDGQQQLCMVTMVRRGLIYYRPIRSVCSDGSVILGGGKTARSFGGVDVRWYVSALVEEVPL